MKKMKRTLSFLLAVALVLTSLPIVLTAVDTKATAAADASLVLNRPMANVVVSDVTRVAYAANSMIAPDNANCVIVKATPSGIPELSSSFASMAYAGETPTATMITFTSGVEFPEAPKITCNNSTVTFSDYAYANGTYTWTVTGGTAAPGSTLLFNIEYSYSEVNAVTGKTYTNTYNSYGTSYVEKIATPAGIYSIKRTYQEWGLGQSTKNRSHVGTFMLGANTYGSRYSGAAIGSIDFQGGSAWSDQYGTMLKVEAQSSGRHYNVAYEADGNRPYTTVYFDKSIHSTLSDLNLRLQTAIPNWASNSDERCTVTLENVYIQPGVVKSFSGDDDSEGISTNTTASLDLGIVTTQAISIKDIGSNFPIYFTGLGNTTQVGSTQYTISMRYQTAAGWSDVHVGHTHSLNIVTYDKGALRTFIEEIMGSDPITMSTTVPAGTFKGYNPQSWYYASGWQAFFNALNAARSCINRPDVTQDYINQMETELRAAYDALQLKTADYTTAKVYYDRAVGLNQEQYTLASWAKLKAVIDSYSADWSVLYQPAVDKFEADINTAMNNLEERQANYTDFLANLNTVNILMQRSIENYGVPATEAYTNWSAVEKVLKESGCVYNELDGYVVETYLLYSAQATVDGYTKLLLNAINALKLAGADYTAANDVESRYNLVNKSQITDASATNIKEKYDALVALHNLDISYQTEINSAVAALETALSEIEYKPADTKAAQEALNKAAQLDRTLYIDMTAVDSAESNLRAKMGLDIRYQTEINNAVTVLNNAISKLQKKSADYTAVNNAIAAVEAKKAEIANTYKEFGFTADVFYSNWSNVESAVNAVERGLDYSKQTVVDGYATAITRALNNLIEATADYSKVNEKKAEAYEYISDGQGIYTPESLTALTNAYTAVVNDLAISKQATVNAYADELDKAIKALEFLPASYDEVNRQLELARAELAKNDAYTAAHPGYAYYTSSSIFELQVAVSSVITGLNINEQTKVDGYAAAIAAAIAGLKCGPADYTKLDAAIATIPADTSKYTTISVKTLELALNSVDRTLTTDKQSTVDRYVTTVSNAIKGLKVKDADYTCVTDALNSVPENADDYTPESWQNLQTKIDAVQYGLDIDHQAQVQKYADDILAAIELLERVAGDYTNVDLAIDQANAKIAEGIYQEDAVAELENYIANIDRTLGYSEQAKINEIADTIVNMTNNLPEKLANYTNLQEIIDLLDNSASEIYTITYRNFDEVMALINDYRTNTVAPNMNLPYTRQAEVDEMAATLQGYIDSLQPAEIFEAKEGSTTVISGSYIYGLKPKLTKAIFNRDYINTANVTVTYSGSASAMYLGTGTVVTVTSNYTNEVIATYTIVIYGDLNGDAQINNADMSVISKVTANIQTLSGAYRKAANINGDYFINAKDVKALADVLALRKTMDQVNGEVV